MVCNLMTQMNYIGSVRVTWNATVCSIITSLCFNAINLYALLELFKLSTKLCDHFA